MGASRVSTSCRTFQTVNPLTGADHDTVAVYSDAELQQRLQAAQSDPRNLDVTVRPA
ncbi:hypothetical protein ACIPSE_46510 [Streptomyces sp. NPDC090106]|uniref:hypothetical protein n=1 Tax=Streptomyces sp. NPDC090106 TaxID=3365946 RepID=UPI00380D8711